MKVVDNEKKKNVDFTKSGKIVLVSSCWIFLFEWKWVFSYFEIPDLFGKLNFESRKNLVDPRKGRCSLIHRKRLSEI